MSVPKSMHKMVMVPNGKGMPSKMNIRNGEISGIFELSVYAIDFFRLSKIKRPSSTPVTIDAKLSSNKIMSAACFETSEPAIPMATPVIPFKKKKVFKKKMFKEFLQNDADNDTNFKSN